MKRYRVGVIGVGSIAQWHSQGYKGVAATQVVAACDLSEERLGRYAAEYGVSSCYTDYAEMLRRESLDIVSICTWPQLHHEMTVEACRQGVKAILCEKPMALSLDEADDMIRTCELAGVKLQVGHQLRYTVQAVRAKQLIDEGQIGGLFSIHGMRTGGDLLTNAIHTADLMRFFAGDTPVDWVFGQVDATRRRTGYGHAVEDSAIGYLRFRDGTRGFLECGEITDLGNHRVLINGTEGQIEVNPLGLHDPKGPWLRARLKNATRWETVPVTFREEDPFIAEVKALLDWIETGKEPVTTARQARATQEVIFAIFESARRRAVVKLPLQVSKHPLFTLMDSLEPLKA
ncbi:MAG: Gfo/Idh/MocA family oxidoreductase [Candidatus Bathyarchaeia archaeon]